MASTTPTNECTAEEPGYRRSTLNRTIYVTNTATADNQKSSALKGSQDAKDKESGEVGRKCSANAKDCIKKPSSKLSPTPAKSVTQWTPEERRDTHEELVQGIGYVDNGSGGVVSISDLWSGGKNGSRREGSQETARTQNHHDDCLPMARKAIVYFVAGLVVADIWNIVGGDMTAGMGQIWSFRVDFRFALFWVQVIFVLSFRDCVRVLWLFGRCLGQLDCLRRWLSHMHVVFPQAIGFCGPSRVSSCGNSCFTTITFN